MARSGAKSTVHKPGRDLFTFDSPPLSEVACGISFQGLPKLTVAEIGRYWATRLLDEYPRSEVQAPLPQPGFPFLIMSPAPRMLFRTVDGSRVVQVQSNWFLFNWVRTKGGPEYPRYHAVTATFEREFSRFQDHLIETDIGGPIDIFQQFTLNYVNHIPRSDGWQTRDELRHLMPDFFATWQTHRALREPSDVLVQFGQELEFGRLNVSVRNGRTQEDPEEVFVVELGVSSPISPKEPGSMKPWFDKAREAIVTSFVELISAEARAKWGLHE